MSSAKKTAADIAADTTDDIVALVVDDDIAWLSLVETTVADSRVRCVAESRHVLPLLEKHRIDVVITDTNMPHLNGIELLRAIRSETKWDALPVVVLFSGLHGSTLTENHVLSLGATLVMTKRDFLWSWKSLLMPLLTAP